MAKRAFAKKFSKSKPGQRRLDLLSVEEERSLILRSQGGDEKATEKLLRRNQGIVISIARSFHRPGISFDDLVQEGNIGLWIAIKHFEFKGACLATYANYWITSRLDKYICKNATPFGRVLTTNDRRKVYYGLGRARREIEHEGKAVDSLALAEKIGVPAKAVVFLQFALRPTLSLDSSIDGARSLGDCLPISLPTPEEDTGETEERRLHQHLVWQALFALSPRERRVFAKRFGLLNDVYYTLEEIGQELGVTREYIRQIEVKAKKKFAYAFKRISKEKY